MSIILKPRIINIDLEESKNINQADVTPVNNTRKFTIKTEDNPSISVKDKSGPNVNIGVSATSNNYESLTKKPRINSVPLIGDLSSTDLKIINDGEISYTSTYSSEYINIMLKSLPSTQEIIGTEENPIILSELPMGSYVLSGITKTSENNPILTTLSRKQYLLDNEKANEGKYTLVAYNPYTTEQTCITFSDAAGAIPTEIKVELVTTETLKSATFDCGNF